MIGQSRNLNYTRKNWGNKGLGMNDRFIQKVFIDWNKIEASSFLRSIEALHNLHEVGSLWGKMELVNLRY